MQKPTTNRGNAKAELKEYKGAIKDYDKAIELDPNFAGAYMNRGNVKNEPQRIRRQ